MHYTNYRIEIMVVRPWHGLQISFQGLGGSDMWSILTNQKEDQPLALVAQREALESFLCSSDFPFRVVPGYAIIQLARGRGHVREECTIGSVKHYPGNEESLEGLHDSLKRDGRVVMIGSDPPENIQQAVSTALDYISMNFNLGEHSFVVCKKDMKWISDHSASTMQLNLYKTVST